MDFSRQCRRFLNFQVFNHQQLKKKLQNISAISYFKNTGKYNKETGITPVTYSLVIADNDEKALMIVNETDGKIVKETVIKNLITYGICCTNFPNKNFIYVSDYANNVIRKFDENLTEVAKLKLSDQVAPLNGPCGIAINSYLDQIQVVDQKNCRVVFFDAKTDEFVSEFKLFREDLIEATKYAKPTSVDLAARVKLEDHLNRIKSRLELDFWPFGLYTKNDRIFITDWERGFLYVYKNRVLENKIGGIKMFSKPRDILLDGLDSILITDVDREMFCFFDNKGIPLFETKIPKEKSSKSNNQKGVFGLIKIDSKKLIYVSNTSIYICNVDIDII